MNFFYSGVVACVLLAPSLSFSQGTWVQKASLPDSARLSAVAFTIGNKGYVGSGGNGNVGLASFWEYDPAVDTWTQKANFAGGIRRFASGFSIGTKGYIGTGIDIDFMFNFFDDLWEYDPTSNTWTQKANFGGGPRAMLAAFSVNGKGYMGTGQDINNNVMQDLWQYDPVMNLWSQKANYPGGPRADLDRAVFTINNKAYWGTGYDGNGNTPTFYTDFWEYDPSINTWIQKANFPGSGRCGATGFSICDYGYLGFGTWWAPSTMATNLNDLWRYDPSANSWSSETPFPGNGRMDLPSFVINNKAYIGTGGDSTGIIYNDLWQFKPLSSLATCDTNLVGLENIAPTFDITIFPNPSDGIFNIQLHNKELINAIELYTTSGEKIYELNNAANRSELSINISLEKSGIYFMRVKTSKGIILKDIFLQKP